MQSALTAHAPMGRLTTTGGLSPGAMTSHRARPRVPTTPAIRPLRAPAAQPQGATTPPVVDAGEPDALELQYGWKGADEFSALGDRVDAPPPPLPPLAATRRGRRRGGGGNENDSKSRVRVVLVRHGQSTWNAEGRVQGSSDGSELTDKGKAQARAAGEMLSQERFSRLFVSPLRRARQTAEAIVAANNNNAESAAAEAQAPPAAPLASLPTVLPALREIDLYAFQGLLKARGKARHGPAYAVWQRAPERFELRDEDQDGKATTHAPVRELWHRAGLAWREVLRASDDDDENDDEDNTSSAVLVVAHNAVNQALIGAALGLGPEHFRRLLQSNGALTVVDFCSGGSGDDGDGDGSAPPPAARAALDRLNVTSAGVLAASLAKPRDRAASDSGVTARVVLVRAGGGTNDEEEETAKALAAALAPARAAGARVAGVLHAPRDAAAEALARQGVVDGVQQEADDDLAPPLAGETRRAFWRRAGRAWRRAAGAALEAAEGNEDGRPPPLVVVVCSAAPPLSALVGHAISGDDDDDDDATGPQARACLGGALRFDAGGATVVDLFGGAGGDGAPRRPSPPAVVRTLNARLSGPQAVARAGMALPPMPEAAADGLLD